MEKTAAAAAAEALPDDAIEEILLRVDDVAALFRCTCKPWRALVANPSFLRRHWPDDSPESCSLLGFFTPTKEKRGGSGKQMFVPAPRSPLVGRCSLSSFFPEDAGGWVEGAEPIASRRGLLLVLLRHQSFTGSFQLAVCNPLAGTCDVLPRLNYCTDTLFGEDSCALILTGADLSSQEEQHPLPGYSTFFKVWICFTEYVWNHSESYSSGHLHMFSSNQSSWTKPRECFVLPYVQDLEMVDYAVVCRGMAHWLLRSTSGYYALQVTADTGQTISFTKLWLDNSYSAWFHVGGTGGTLSLLVLCRSYRGDEIQVWTPTQDGQWLCTGMIKLQTPKQTQPLTSLFRMIKLKTPKQPKQEHKVGKLSAELLFSDSGMFLADLATGAMEDITAKFSGLDSRRSIPFEASWTDFFSSRLGTVGRSSLVATTSYHSESSDNFRALSSALFRR